MSRRGGHYPVRHSVMLSADLAFRIRSEARNLGIAPGTLIRSAVESGIDDAIDKERMALAMLNELKGGAGGAS